MPSTRDCDWCGLPSDDRFVRLPCARCGNPGAALMIAADHEECLRSAKSPIGAACCSCDDDGDLGQENLR